MAFPKRREGAYASAGSIQFTLAVRSVDRAFQRRSQEGLWGVALGVGENHPVTCCLACCAYETNDPFLFRATGQDFLYLFTVGGFRRRKSLIPIRFRSK